MLNLDLEATVHHWILRMLASRRGERAFLRERGFADDDVADFLGLTDMPDLAAYDLETARSALRELVAATGDLASDRLPASVEANLQAIAATFSFEQLSTRLLFLVAILETSAPFRDAFHLNKAKSGGDYVRNLSLALHASVKEVCACLRAEGRLMRSGLVKWGSGGMRSRNTSGLELCREGLSELLVNGRFTVDALLQGVAIPSTKAQLRRRNFRHMENRFDDLAHYLRRVFREGRAGANCLLYGPPGTGKTEMARALAQLLRLPLFEVSGEDASGDSLPAVKRLENLRLAQTLLRDRRALLLFDECEDVFRGESLFSRSLADQRKAWMNRMLETNAVPVLWISNSHRCLDPAFIRRFDIVTEVAPPPARQRERLYRRICADTLPSALLRRVAAHEGVTPAVVARAQSVATDLHGQGREREEAFTRLIEGTLRAQGHRGPRIAAPSTGSAPLRFDHTYLHPDPPLDQLIARLHHVSACRCLLHGPPGTGKTAFARWFAEERGAPLHVKRASDLLSPYFGQTEALLAQAFSAAEEERAVLMIDEVDTFLRDRRSAQRSWEVSQVNEFLTCLENFEGLFLCSTNLPAELDPACLRRFDLKIRLGYLDAPRARRLLAAHCRHLGMGRPRKAHLAAVSDLPNTTPGDFANVARQHTFQPFENPSDFLRALDRECAAKQGREGRTAGFC
jgi:transitional endoplasmic reticulum ATPase